MTLKKAGGIPTLDLRGPEGNAFGLLGLARRTMMDLDYDKVRLDEVMAEMTAGDYTEMVEVFEREFSEYFDIIVPDDWEV